MKNRNKQRENRRKKNEIFKNYKVNEFGIKDLTAYYAIQRCEGKGVVTIGLK